MPRPGPALTSRWHTGGPARRRGVARAGFTAVVALTMTLGQWSPQLAAAVVDALPTCAAPTIVGTVGNDTLVGTGGPDVIDGLGGNDSISGLGGDDVICGGPGRDTIDGGAGDDQLVGGEDSDVLLGGLGSDHLWGLAGRDRLYTRDLLAATSPDPGAHDVLHGGLDFDVLTMDDGVAELYQDQALLDRFAFIYSDPAVVVRGGIEAGTVIEGTGAMSLELPNVPGLHHSVTVDVPANSLVLDGVSAPLRGILSLYVNAPTSHWSPPPAPPETTSVTFTGDEHHNFVRLGYDVNDVDVTTGGADDVVLTLATTFDTGQYDVDMGLGAADELVFNRPGPGVDLSVDTAAGTIVDGAMTGTLSGVELLDILSWENEVRPDSGSLDVVGTPGPDQIVVPLAFATIRLAGRGGDDDLEVGVYSNHKLPSRPQTIVTGGPGNDEIRDYQTLGHARLFGDDGDDTLESIRIPTPLLDAGAGKDKCYAVSPRVVGCEKVASRPPHP